MLESENAQAMEYVLGTLRGPGREAFKVLLQDRKDLQLQVSFWEEHLMDMQCDETKKPYSHTWANIQKAINGGVSPQKNDNPLLRWLNSVLLWQATAACMFIALLGIAWLDMSSSQSEGALFKQPNTDYVAVMTDEEGEAILTAMTSSSGEQLWLKWESVELPEEGSMQLWAMSKTDGGVRPILVVEDALIKRVAISEAEWRLIKDSSHLMLTEEEAGGSAFDEPSEMLLAKGVCIRLTERKESKS